MNTLRLVLATLLIVSTADAQVILFGKKKESTSTPSYLLSEKFEGTGTPSGWTPTGTFDFDNSTNPLAGTQDFRMADASSTVDTVAWAGQSDIFIAFMLYTDVAPGSLANIGYFYDAGDAQVARLSFTSGATTLRGLAIGGTISSSTANSVSTVAGTGTPVKMRYQKGTGANATVTVWVASGGAWGTGVSSSDGTATSDATYFRFNNTASYNINPQYDNVIVSSSDIAVAEVTGL